MVEILLAALALLVGLRIAQARQYQLEMLDLFNDLATMLGELFDKE